MEFPIRCFTCGAPIAQQYNDFLRLINEESKTVEESLNHLKINRVCCRRMFVSHIDMSEVARYKKR